MMELEMSELAFEKWVKSQDFWKPNSRREELFPEWQRLALNWGVPNREISEVFDAVVGAMRDEYGG